MAAFDFGIRINAIDNASSVLGSLTGKISGMSAGIGDRMAKFGMISNGITAASGALEGMSKGFVELDTSARNIGALGVKNFGELQGSFIELSKSFPNSAAEIGEAMGQAIGSGVIETSEAGIVAKEELEKFGTVAGQLAIAGGASMAEAVKGIGATLNAYGMKADQAERVSTTLFNTFNAGDVSVRELSSYLAAVTPVAAAAGVSIEQIGGAVATMTKQGMGASDVMTKLKSFLVELQKPGAALKPIMEKAGVSVEKLQAGEMTLQEATKRIEAEAKKQGKGIAEVFSSIDAGAVVLATAGKNSEGAMDDLAAVMKKGTVADGFAVQAEGMAVKAKLFENQLESLKIGALSSMGGVGIGVVGVTQQIGKMSGEITALAGLKALVPPGAFDSLKNGAVSAFGAIRNSIPAVTGAVSNVATAVRGQLGTMMTAMRGMSLGSVWQGLSSGASAAVSGIGSALSNGAGALKTFAAQQLLALRGSALFSNGLSGFASTLGSGLMNGLRSAISGVMTMNMAFLTSPVTWIVLAIAAAAFLIYKNWEPIKAFFGGLFDGISGFFDGFMDGIKAAFEAPWSILQEVRAALSPIIDAVSALFTPVSAVAGATGQAANQFAWLKDVGIVAGQYLGTAFRMIVTPLLWVVKVVAQVIGLITGITTSGGNMAKVLVGAFTAITLPIQMVMGLIGGLFTFIQSLFSGASLAEAGSKMIESLWAGIQATWGKLVDGVKGLVGGITNLFSGNKEQAKSVSADAKKTLEEPAKTVPEAKKEAEKALAKKELKAPKVGKPKVPKPDAPKLQPLNPPEAPDFSWIEKQNLEPPKIHDWKPLQMPEVDSKKTLQSLKTVEFDINEALNGFAGDAAKSMSTIGTGIESPNTFGAIKPPNIGDLMSGIKLPELSLPKLNLPNIELPKLEMPNIELPKIDVPSLAKNVGGMLPDEVKKVAEMMDVPVPGLKPKSGEKKPIAPAAKKDKSTTTAGLLPAIPAIAPIVSAPTQAGNVTINLTVNISASPAQSTGQAAEDLRAQITKALQEITPELVRSVQQAQQQEMRVQFTTL